MLLRGWRSPPPCSAAGAPVRDLSHLRIKDASHSIKNSPRLSPCGDALANHTQFKNFPGTRLGAMGAERGCFFSGQKEDHSKLSRWIPRRICQVLRGRARPAFDDSATLPRNKSIPFRRNLLGQCTMLSDAQARALNFRRSSFMRYRPYAAARLPEEIIHRVVPSAHPEPPCARADDAIVAAR